LAFIKYKLYYKNIIKIKMFYVFYIFYVKVPKSVENIVKVSAIVY